MHAIIIVIAAQKDQANALAEAQGWGPNNFSIGLNATGLSTDDVTHYWCAPEVTEKGWATIHQLLDQFYGSFGELYNANTEPNFPWETLTRLGLKVQQSEMGLP